MGPEMEIAASRAATAVAESMRMSADKIDEVRMAVVEACINAIEHSRSSDQTVYLSFLVFGDREPERLEVVVRDTGVGFAPDGLEEPRIEEKLTSERKRGWGLQDHAGTHGRRPRSDPGTRVRPSSCPRPVDDRRIRQT